MAFPGNPGFRARLMMAMLALVLLTGATVAVVMLYNLFEEETARAEEQLGVAERVAREVISARTQLLVSNLEVVSEDFGFKSAIASRDMATIESALENHSARADADLAMIADRDGRLIANLEGLDKGSPIPFQELFESASSGDSTSAIAAWQDDVYQLLMVPIEGAGLRAWLAAGFRLDDDFAQLIADLSATDVVFQSVGSSGNRILGTSRDAPPTDALPQHTEMDSDPELREQSGFFMRPMALQGAEYTVARAWLLKDRASALARYYTLMLETLTVIALVLAVAIILAMATARVFGRPIFKLSRFAEALGEDRHAQPPDLRVSGEPQTLLNSLVTMRDSIISHEQRIEHEATHDSLTGLPNWRALRARLQGKLQQNERACVIAIDMPNIRTINEMLGFRFGDETLIATGLRLNGFFQRPGQLARTGGSQFTAVIPHRDEDSLMSMFIELRQQIEASVEVFGSPVHVNLDIAALWIPEQASSIDEIQRRLDLTLERARRSPSHTALYVPGGDEEHLREIRLIRDLSDAIQNRSMQLNYQPKIDLQSGRLIGVEALLRWQHAEFGFVSPEEFIPLAESSGQTLALTDMVLALAAADSQQWEPRVPGLKLAINLSALDLANSQLPNQIRDHFQHWQDQLHRLTFEVTESAVMSDTGVALETLEQLRGLGVALSVDDFGTGHSSLAQLRKLPVQELKIDKSFVLNLASDEQDQLIVKSTLDLAHGLRLRVCAEGIEDHASLEQLRDWGCEEAQGFYMGRPMSYERLMDWAGEYREWAQEQGIDRTGDNA